MHNLRRSEEIKMNNYVKTPHTAIFTAPTLRGKTTCVLDLLEGPYLNHFDKIIVLCKTIKRNTTYLDRPWVIRDKNVSLVNPGDNLFGVISYISEAFAGLETLFILDDLIACEGLDKKRSPMLDLASTGRWSNHYLWFLTQSYIAIPKDIRRQKKQLFVWPTYERSDMKTIYEETGDIIKDTQELEHIKKELKKGKYSYMYVRLEYPDMYEIIHNNK